jgi:hypothetical protein
VVEHSPQRERCPQIGAIAGLFDIQIRQEGSPSCTTSSATLGIGLELDRIFCSGKNWKILGCTVSIDMFVCLCLRLSGDLLCLTMGDLDLYLT